MSEGSRATHRPSHRTLLRPRGPRTNRRLDAIVVSAARSAEFLLPSMVLAATAQTPLVVLCSGAATISEAAGLADEVPALKCTLVDVRDYRPKKDVLTFRTDGWRDAGVPRLGDLNIKRNLALLLAHYCAWNSVLLLDDDIREFEVASVRTAVETLRPGGATGLLVRDYPDNSVVCHARTLAWQPQEVFVSGAALVVDTTVVDSFFPDVYNEDWLFLHDRVRDGRVAAVGTVEQVPYEPFRDPGRAVAEEFGDTLAEGLMSLVHAGAPVEDAQRRWWWEAVLDERGRMLDRLAADLRTCRGSAEALVAVQAAKGQHARLDAGSFVEWVGCWRADLDTWRAVVRSLRPVGSFAAALESVGLRGETETLLWTA